MSTMMVEEQEEQTTKEKKPDIDRGLLECAP